MRAMLPRPLRAYVRRLPFATALVALILSGSVVSAKVIVVEAPRNSGAEAAFQSAKASSEDAAKAYEAGQFPLALSHAEAAYRAYPNASTAMQMGAIYSQSGRPADAFRWYLVARNSRPSEGFRGPINEALEGHGEPAKLGVVRVVTSPKAAKAMVMFNGDEGEAEGGTYVGLSYGKHMLVITAPGFLPVTREVTVSKSDIQTLKVKLEAKPEAKPVEVEEASIAAPLGLIIGGLVLAGAGAGLHAWGLGADAELESSAWTLPTQNTTEQVAKADFQSKVDQAATGTTTAFVLYGLGAAVIVTGAVLWSLQGSDEGGADKSGANVVVAPAWVPHGGGVTVGGSF